MKGNEALTDTLKPTWINCKNIIMSRTSQTQELHMTPFT